MSWQVRIRPQFQAVTAAMANTEAMASMVNMAATAVMDVMAITDIMRKEILRRIRKVRLPDE